MNAKGPARFPIAGPIRQFEEETALPLVEESDLRIFHRHHDWPPGATLKRHRLIKDLVDLSRGISFFRQIMFQFQHANFSGRLRNCWNDLKRPFRVPMDFCNDSAHD
jgi:hypothetical protein